MQAEPWVARADHHSRLRWVGIALFSAAVVVFVGGVAAIAAGHAPFRTVFLCIFAVGLSLGSFGTNDDTTLHALAELARRGGLPPRHQAEWERERAVRGARLSTIHAHPKTAWILPPLAVAALCLAAWRVGAAWGLLS